METDSWLAGCNGGAAGAFENCPRRGPQANQTWGLALHADQALLSNASIPLDVWGSLRLFGGQGQHRILVGRGPRLVGKQTSSGSIHVQASAVAPFAAGKKDMSSVPPEPMDLVGRRVLAAQGLFSVLSV